MNMEETLAMKQTMLLCYTTGSCKKKDVLAEVFIVVNDFYEIIEPV
jgi:hypothetical protein